MCMCGVRLLTIVEIFGEVRIFLEIFCLFSDHGLFHLYIYSDSRFNYCGKELVSVFPVQ